MKALIETASALIDLAFKVAGATVFVKIALIDGTLGAQPITAVVCALMMGFGEFLPQSFAAALGAWRESRNGDGPSKGRDRDAS